MSTIIIYMISFILKFVEVSFEIKKIPKNEKHEDVVNVTYHHQALNKIFIINTIFSHLYILFIIIYYKYSGIGL